MNFQVIAVTDNAPIASGEISEFNEFKKVFIGKIEIPKEINPRNGYLVIYREPEREPFAKVPMSETGVWTYNDGGGSKSGRAACGELVTPDLSINGRVYHAGIPTQDERGEYIRNYIFLEVTFKPAVDIDLNGHFPKWLVKKTA